jgi:hypothetical protein
MLIILQTVVLLMALFLALPFCLWLVMKLVRGLIYCLFVICILTVFGCYGIWAQISKHVQDSARQLK